MMNVVHDANDCGPRWCSGATHMEAFAQCVFPGKVFARKGLVDNGYRRSAGRVGVGEVAPRNYWNLHGVKITGADLEQGNEWGRSHRRAWLAFHHYARIHVVGHEGKAGSRGYGLCSR